jgi:hypothetical protein
MAAGHSITPSATLLLPDRKRFLHNRRPTFPDLTTHFGVSEHSRNRRTPHPALDDLPNCSAPTTSSRRDISPGSLRGGVHVEISSVNGSTTKDQSRRNCRPRGRRSTGRKTPCSTETARVLWTSSMCASVEPKLILERAPEIEAGGSEVPAGNPAGSEPAVWCAQACDWASIRIGEQRVPGQSR